MVLDVQLHDAFLATGILQLRGHNGAAGWRYLFVIEGIFTCLCGLFSFALMPPGPTQTKAWFRPSGWFTDRVLRDDPSKSDMHSHQGMTVKMIGILSATGAWSLYILGMTHMSCLYIGLHV
ncbi:hypothetical protein BGY98DRAFT_930075 [Russula aff. rugulosa BPL654]|nr:hypothetical protein BGY98DRAFT_930075 [Russula aff. rugulosa BPL654]